MKSAAILGGGPAGCQCALWLKMLGHEVVIIEQAQHLGGLQAMSPYQNNWIVGVMDLTGQELAANMQRHIERMDIPVIFAATITEVIIEPPGFKLQLNTASAITAKHLVIATGVRPQHENFSAADNILIGPGKHVYDYDFANKRVAILGGGDNAAENYQFIKTKHPACCHIYARNIRARENLWRVVNPEDVFSTPIVVEQETMTITQQAEKRQYDVLVVMYGWQANFPSALLPYQTQLLSASGFIQTDNTCRTPVTNIYAIGEVANRAHPCVVTAMADGVTAAKAIEAATPATVASPE